MTSLLVPFTAMAQGAAPATKKPAAPSSTAPRTGATHAATRRTAARKQGMQQLDRIAAVVNDDVVLESDVDEQVVLFLQRNNARPDSATVDTLRRQVLDQMINEKLIVAEAKRQGMTASATEVSRQVDQAIGEARQRMGGEAEFQDQLKKENLTEDKLREKYRTEIERQMLAQRLMQKQLPQHDVSQSEAETFFQQNPDKFPKFPAQLRLAVIQIPVTSDSASDARGKAAAIAARKRLMSGERFAKIASEVSEDPGSAKASGDLGFFTRGTMDPAFEKAAFSLPLNTVSEPVRTSFGWHLIEVLERDTVKTVAHTDSVGADGLPVLEAHVRHILIRVPVNDTDSERARLLAERVRAEASRGTDFASLVKRYSKYQGQQTDAGDIGYVGINGLQDNIRTGLDSLKVGAVSEALANPVGYNIFKVIDRKPERPYTLDEIRKDLPQAVAELKQRERFEAWVKTLRAKAHIEIRG
ncbi:MAG TPA: peptidylprolyl isomerase [Candidatus Udaeobacter sp.]|nr:peptidylprolyl isomerase [Candidatus Udaeobacter sp.]